MFKFKLLDPTEECIILLCRIEMERLKVLYDLRRHDKGVRKIEKMLERIEKLGGDPNAKIEVVGGKP